MCLFDLRMLSLIQTACLDFLLYIFSLNLWAKTSVCYVKSEAHSKLWLLTIDIVNLLPEGIQ